MNEETLQVEENAEEIIPDAQVENESNQLSNKRIENDEQRSDIPNRRTQSSSGNVRQASNGRRTTTYADDDEILLEISSAHSSHFYDIDEETMDFEDEEFSSNTILNHQKERERAQQGRLSLFNPKDPQALELKTDDASLRLSTLPRLAPVEGATSAEVIFNAKVFEGISFDTLDETNSIASETEAQQETAAQKEDFFEKLGPVPDVKDIKEGSEIPEDFKPRIYFTASSPSGGKFVDPLTGALLPPVAIESKKVEELLIEEDELSGEEEQKSEMTDMEFDDYDAMYPDTEATTQQKVTVQDEELIDIFIATKSDDKLQVKEAIGEETETEAYKAAKSAEYFLDELINWVVRFFEQKEGDQYMREKLDKKKLFFEIENVVKELLIERSVQSFLDRKIENYYRRKRQLRQITPERPEMLAAEKEKFLEQVQNLDYLLGREAYTAKKTTAKIEELFKESEEAEKLALAERKQFIDLVKKTFRRENMPKLEALVAKELEHMATVSEEISKVRAVFISRQHMLGTLQAQLEELENIGNGLRVIDYETIERQTLRLGKKIEEHNNDLNRFYNRFRNTIHSMAHSKIRNEMLVNCIKNQIKELADLDGDQISWRQKIFQLKKERQHIQRQISDLSYQCGLLDKPEILLDYDRTVELVEKKRNEVENLRETLKREEEKLKRVEMACKTV